MNIRQKQQTTGLHAQKSRHMVKNVKLHEELQKTIEILQ